jgi:hypothetical protein
MNETKLVSSDKFKLAAKMETVRSDERGSLTLLAGMMVFLATMFAVIAFDTNRAIYDRILAQNAVDAAADSAALWQARFCNLEQQLNNLHYTVDTVACVAEGVATAACLAAAVLDVLQFVPFCEWAAALIPPVCFVGCDPLCPEDAAQHLFYDALMPVQQAIVDIAPFMAFGYANAAAYGSGANNVFDSASQTITETINDGINLIPGANLNLSSTFSSIDSVIGSTLGQIPIYAMPLDPTSLELGVHTNENNGSPPLYWPPEVPAIGDGVGMVACAEYGYDDFQSGVDYSADGDENRDGSDQYKPQWGWNDLYYKGNPGYMTWVAGVTNRNEILGLGNLVWLNSQTSAAQSQMYTGPATGGGSLTIPAFLAIASSQVEGTPVICQGNVDAQGYLIKVYIPTGTNNPGSSIPFPFTIYH